MARTINFFMLFSYTSDDCLNLLVQDWGHPLSTIRSPPAPDLKTCHPIPVSRNSIASEPRSQCLRRIFMWLRHRFIKRDRADYTETALLHKHKSCPTSPGEVRPAPVPRARVAAGTAPPPPGRREVKGHFLPAAGSGLTTPRLRKTWIEPSLMPSDDVPDVSYPMITSGLPSPLTSATVMS